MITFLVTFLINCCAVYCDAFPSEPGLTSGSNHNVASLIYISESQPPVTLPSVYHRSFLNRCRHRTPNNLIDNAVTQQYILPSGAELVPMRILTLGRIRGTDIPDEEVARAGSKGFIGCLTSVQFNQATPLKAALQNRASSLVSIQGRLEESDCGTSSSKTIDATTRAPSVDESSKTDRGKAPLTKAEQNDSALIGGVVAAVVFTTLCVLAVLIRILYQHRKTQAPPTIVAKNPRPSMDLEPHKANHVRKEYFI